LDHAFLIPPKDKDQNKDTRNFEPKKKKQLGLQLEEYIPTRNFQKRKKRKRKREKDQRRGRRGGRSAGSPPPM